MKEILWEGVEEGKKDCLIKWKVVFQVKERVELGVECGEKK
jgi:hypothetical protein